MVPVLGLTWCVSDREGDIQGSVTGVRRAEGGCGRLLFAPGLSRLDQGGVRGSHTHLNRSVSFPAFVRG